MTHDDAAKAAIQDSINLNVPWYLMASYLYYHRDFSLISDSLFDQICLTLDHRWDEIIHAHKHVIDRQDLAAGSCFLGLDAFPSITRSTAEMLAGKMVIPPLGQTLVSPPPGLPLKQMELF
jgi:hypothetical protein